LASRRRSNRDDVARTLTADFWTGDEQAMLPGQQVTGGVVFAAAGGPHDNADTVTAYEAALCGERPTRTERRRVEIVEAVAMRDEPRRRRCRPVSPSKSTSWWRLAAGCCAARSSPLAFDRR
jgi:hypothetical protein